MSGQRWLPRRLVPGDGPADPVASAGTTAPGPSPALQRVALLDQERLALTRPADWTNPSAAPKYDLLVVGGGSAGLAVAVQAAAQGARVALVERHQLGGKGYRDGVAPLLALVSAARAAAAARSGAAHGVGFAAPVVAFDALLERIARLRAAAAHHHGAAALAASGIDVFFGDAVFSGPGEVKLGVVVLKFERACIATGSRPYLPPIPGLADAGAATVETLWDAARQQPKKLVVLGGTSVGCALAQAFARLGTQVTLLETVDRVLPLEDADAAAVVQEALVRDGVEVRTSASVARVIRVGPQVGIAYVGPPGSPATGDHLVLATGRVPNIEGLALEAAGVTYERSGIRVDEQLRTSNRNVFALGSCTTLGRDGQGTVPQARVLVRNALENGKERATLPYLPACTHTDPALARVGPTLAHAQSGGLAVEVFQVPFAEDDRAVLDGATEGFVRLVVHAGRDELAGALAVGRGADELLALVSQAIANGQGVAALASTVAPHPSRAEAVRRAAELAMKSRAPAGGGLFKRLRRGPGR